MYSNIKFDGKTLKPFPLKSGTRKGEPLYHYVLLILWCSSQQSKKNKRANYLGRMKKYLPLF